MRIGIDIRELEKGKKTGIGRILLGFLDYVSLLEDRQDACPTNEYILFGNQKTEPQAGSLCHLKDVKVRIIRERVTFVWDQIKLPIAISKERIDIFFSPYFKVPILAPCPLVNVIHDLTPLHHPVSGIRHLASGIYYRYFGRLCAKFSKKVITISKYSKREIEEVLRIPGEKIEIIYPGVKAPSNRYTDISEKYGIQGKYILYIGGIKPHKNIESLIKAYSLLSPDLKREYQLVIGGRKNRHTEYLEKIIEKLNIRDRVLFPGLIADKDLASVYKEASLFVFPSLYEGFGLPPLEAMACGVPVIVSNTTSLPEVVGEAGLLVNPYKVDEIKVAIIKVLTDSTLRNDLIRKGLERSRGFTLKKTADQILEIFVEACPVGEIKISK